MRRHADLFHILLLILIMSESLHQKPYLRTYAPSEDSDQTAHSRSLIRTFTGCILDSQGRKVSSSGLRILCSDSLDAQILLFNARPSQKVGFPRRGSPDYLCSTMHALASEPFNKLTCNLLKLTILIFSSPQMGSLTLKTLSKIAADAILIF